MALKIGTHKKEIWYRYESVVYASLLDEWESPLGPPRVDVVLREYEVVKHTPCGVRLDNNRFVNHSWRKKFALPTKEAALHSFIARKKRESSILKNKMQMTNDAKAIAERLLTHMSNPGKIAPASLNFRI